MPRRGSRSRSGSRGRSRGGQRIGSRRPNMGRFRGRHRYRGYPYRRGRGHHGSRYNIRPYYNRYRNRMPWYNFWRPSYWSYYPYQNYYNTYSYPYYTYPYYSSVNNNDYLYNNPSQFTDPQINITINDDQKIEEDTEKFTFEQNLSKIEDNICSHESCQLGIVLLFIVLLWFLRYRK